MAAVMITGFWTSDIREQTKTTTAVTTVTESWVDGVDVLSIVGMVVAVISLAIHALKRIQEKPKLRVGDLSVWLEKVGKTIEARVSFNIDNIGDRSTTVTRITAILGPEVETIEAFRIAGTHSSIRCPEKPDSAITFRFPELVAFADGTKKKYFEKHEELTLWVWHTHGLFEKVKRLPPASRWDEHRLWKGGPLLLWD